ncbi:MAG: pantetheine-phosphate adenylyltransferase [Eubacterium sp.]
MIRAIYPGSFDPITLGHLDIIKRSAESFDELIIGVLNNGEKCPLFSADERVNMIKECVASYDNIKVQSFDGLLVDFADESNAKIIIRGLRAVTDFEYELQMAQTNHIMNPNIETIFFTTKLEYAYLSSSTVREVAKNKGNINKFVPQCIVDKVYNKYK